MAVDIQASNLTIQMVDPHTLKPHPEALLVPMSEDEEKALRSDIAENGIMHAIDISSDKNVLDGVHRWRYSIEFGFPFIPVVIFSYSDPDEETAHAIRANFKRRQLTEGQKGILAVKLMPIEKRLAEKRMRQGGIESASTRERDEHGKLLPSEQSKVLPIGSTLDENNGTIGQIQPKQKDSKKQRKPDQGEAAEKAGKTTGVSSRTVYRVQAVQEKAPELLNAVAKGNMSINKAYNQVKSEEKAQEVKSAIASGRQLTDLEIMQKLGIPVQPYDVWNFPNCDSRFGHDYPGRIPGQLVAHCLYFWTEQGDIVLDPMGGSGTTIDVCKALNRNPLAYDAHPCREDITLHNLATQGWPETTKDAKLIFWDPPYFKKMDNDYGEQSISRLDRSEYLAFFDHMAETIPDGFHGRLAFLMSDYNDDNSLEESIWFTDYINIFTRHSWRIERFIYPPLTTQSIHPDIVQKFRSSKRLARLGRVLVMMSR